ncbi:hypothetical protein GGR50DRAFT_259563 [Xylaria sp. CBS 124048]|nr:hypothetical protein GGR50DRAFT_259563 [Xylaria sp. CBS 124048]
MPTPHAIRPLLGFGSRLIVDQFFPTSAGRTAKGFFSSASTRTPIPSPTRICWHCRHDNAAKLQQKRLSSSSPKPPSDPGRGDFDQSFDHLRPTSFSHSTAADAYRQENPLSGLHGSQQQQQKNGTEGKKDYKEEKAQSQSQSQQSTTSPSDLPSALNSQRSALNQSLSAFMDRAQTTLFTASQRINDLTGYSSIETLKVRISDLEAQLRDAQTNLTNARSAYKNAVSDRSSTQREVTTLLARQKTWTPIDFERFTTLYRQDYEFEASVGRRAAELEHAEQEAERLGRELGASILARYHEEQIWSDKIRRMSTWGTWGLMGVNILLFLLLQFGAEPWRRRRLVRGFEEKVREAIAEERVAREEEAERVAAVNAATAAAAEASAAALAAEKVAKEETAALAALDVVTPVSPIAELPLEELPRISWREALTDPTYWRTAIVDLVSDRRISIRMRDVSLIAAEGVAIGAAVAGTVIIFIFRRA